jgi:hypothetical protein
MRLNVHNLHHNLLRSCLLIPFSVIFHYGICIRSVHSACLDVCHWEATAEQKRKHIVITYEE